MSQIRAQILPVDSPLTAAARITINAPSHTIFDLLASPADHKRFDGSGTVRGSLSGPDRLFLGAQFGMSMKIKLRYRIKNTVITFEENKKITWCHLMKWRWSYELNSISATQTVVTESFDARDIPAFATWWLERTGAMAHNPKWMAKSLVALKSIAEG